MTIEYKKTVFLPKTNFSMRGDLVEKEPKMVQRWQETNLYERLLKSRQGKETFILHDGPPYANGEIHLGTALNKILKDIVNRTQLMMGKQVPYVPGWDCHGLPIEWKIEEKYRKAGKSKDTVSVLEFRQECREFARQWIDVQIADFKRLGVLGDWKNPYLTMSPEAAAIIVRELGKFLLDGSLYKGVKPVMWSVVEQTALAEMEVEYQDKTSPSIFVKFPFIKTSDPTLAEASAVIWTTTPWTLPANRAICYGEDFQYGLFEITQTPDDSLMKIGDKLLLSIDLLESFKEKTGVEGSITHTFLGETLKGCVTAHPLRRQGYEFDVPLFSGSHVTLEAGTGLVHTAPSHGEDGYRICREFGLGIPDLVSGSGVYYENVPLFAGLHVFKADTPIMDKLKEVGCLLHASKIVHSYPHSWRSKAPLIFRTTPQWFISMEKTELRQKALNAIDQTHWIPARGRNRIHAMVSERPDWCLSRQRVWGVPITVFVSNKTGELLRDAETHERIVKAFQEKGSDVWFEEDPRQFLSARFDPKDYDPVYDILDVWFDSGSTHAFVLENRPELRSPADLYLEGSDQHRGWFQSSLLESCGTRGCAPYKAVLTHGFVLDDQGRKMSKSLGNTILPQDVIKQMGAEILRLWIVNSDYGEDIRIGKETLTRQQDVYRRLRNTLRYLLGALDGYQKEEALSYAEMPDLEKWVLHRVYELNQAFKEAAVSHSYQKFHTHLHTFCSVDLSAYYFDIRKDSLYCDSPTTTIRRATRTVFDILFNHLVCWMAPVLCFTAEEAYLTRWGDEKDSLAFESLPEASDVWHNPSLASRMEHGRDVRKFLTAAIELKRAAGVIGSSLQAKLIVYDPDAQVESTINWAEQAIVSALEIRSEALPEDSYTSPEFKNLGVVVQVAEGQKCERCWQVLPEVGNHATYPDICNRCVQAVETFVSLEDA